MNEQYVKKHAKIKLHRPTKINKRTKLSSTIQVLSESSSCRDVHDVEWQICLLELKDV